MQELKLLLNPAVLILVLKMEVMMMYAVKPLQCSILDYPDTCPRCDSEMVRTTEGLLLLAYNIAGLKFLSIVTMTTASASSPYRSALHLF